MLRPQQAAISSLLHTVPNAGKLQQESAVPGGPGAQL